MNQNKQYIQNKKNLRFKVKLKRLKNLIISQNKPSRLSDSNIINSNQNLNLTIVDFHKQVLDNDCKQSDYNFQQYSNFLLEESKIQQNYIQQQHETNELLKQEIYNLLQDDSKYDEKVLDKQKIIKQQYIIIEQEEQAIIKKFYLIQRCAEFLDELDDFDKLALIFIYDKPENFNLNEILNVIEIQLQKPKEQYQKQTLDEFIQRLKFNQVSIRMNLFIRFHQNNLQEVVNQLILVYKQQKSQETLLSYKYQELLDQQRQLSKSDKYISESLVQTHLKYLQESNEKPDLNDYEQDVAIRMMEHYFAKIQQFMTKTLNFLIQSLIRFFNTVQQIQDILKSCKKEDFSAKFYLKIIYTKLFELIKKEQLTKSLESEFLVKFINENLKNRHSNQILNTIMDQIEMKIQNQIDQKRKFKKTELNDDEKASILTNIIERNFPSSSNFELKQIIEYLKLDHIFWRYIEPIQFEEILLVILEEFKLKENVNYLNLLSEIETSCRTIKMEIFEKKSLLLLTKITEFFDGMKSGPNQAFIDQFNQKFEQQMMKMSEAGNFKYEIKNQRRSSVEIKIQEIENYRGKIKEAPLEPIKICEESTIQTKDNQKFKVSRLDMLEFNGMSQTLNKIKKDLMKINSQQKKKFTKSIDIYNVPIFNYLHTKHQKHRRKTEVIGQSISIGGTKLEDSDIKQSNQDSNNISRRKSVKQNIIQYQLENQQPSQSSIQMQPEKITKKLPNRGSKVYLIQNSKSQYYLKLPQSQIQTKSSKELSNASISIVKNQTPTVNPPLASFSFLNWADQRKHYKLKLSQLPNQSKSSMQLTKVSDSVRIDE